MFQDFNLQYVYSVGPLNQDQTESTKKKWDVIKTSKWILEERDVEERLKLH
jgi:hypothetical protein